MSHDHHGAHKHAAQLPFVDFHCTVEGGRARIEGILPVSNIEGLVVGLAVDASGSFKDEYGETGLVARMFGGSVNQVNQALQVIVPYLTEMDSSHSIRMIYWAAGDGRTIYPVVEGEINAAQAAAMTFAGPPRADFGTATHLLPAIRDFVAHVRDRMAAGETVNKALLTVVSDGMLHDYDAVIAYAKDLQKAMADGTMPQVVVSIVGVGDQVSEDQLEELLHDTFDSDAPSAMFCYNMVNEMPDLSAIVAHLVDAGVVAFHGGAQITDSVGNVLVTFEDAVPAFIELEVDANVGHIVFTGNGQSYEIEIDEDDDHEGGEHHDGDEDEDHEPAMAGAVGHHGH